MKLLLDQNLSPHLCDRLRDVWADLVHVRTVGLATADDPVVWEYARQHDLIIVSKDGDFSGRAFLFGAPPKVIWVAVGNCSTRQIEQLLCRRRAQVEDFAASEDATLLVLELSAVDQVG